MRVRFTETDSGSELLAPEDLPKHLHLAKLRSW